MGNIIQIILALPKLIGIVNDIINWFKAYEARKKIDSRNKAIDEVVAAKTKEEVINATRDLTNNP